MLKNEVVTSTKYGFYFPNNISQSQQHVMVHIVWHGFSFSTPACGAHPAAYNGILTSVHLPCPASRSKSYGTIRPTLLNMIGLFVFPSFHLPL